MRINVEHVVSAEIILIAVPIIATILGIEKITQLALPVDIFAIILLAIIVFLRPFEEESQYLAPIS